MTYYNTLPKQGLELKKGVKKAVSQEKEIRLMLADNDKPFTPRQIYNSYKAFTGEIDLNSVRRSLDTLKKEGFIEETGNRVYTFSKAGERELKKA